MDKRETADFLSGCISTVVAKLAAEGVTVTSVVADNAKNLQKGIALASLGSGVIQANCFAHTLNLLMEDLGSLFSTQFDQMVEVECFFRTRCSISCLCK